jgi:tetratricopeptide (TPR) repeat protein
MGVRAGGIALVLAALAFAVGQSLQPMGENDLFFHLKLGEIILDERVIPFRNLFSFTHPDHPDPDLAWAFQVLCALLHRAGGFGAIVLLKVACVTVAAGLALHTARLRGAGAIETALASVVAVLAADQRIVERPHLVTFVGIGVLGVLWAHIAAGRARLVFWIPPLALVWANFHAGVFFAPLLLALRGGGALVDARLRGERPPVPPGRLALVFALTCAATLATPAGLRLGGYLLWHTGLGATRVIEEFRRADAWSDPLFFALIAVCGVTLIARPRAFRFADALPALVVGVLAWRSVRFVAEWAFLVAPLAATGLGAARRALRLADGPPLRAIAAAALLAHVVAYRASAPPPLALAADVVPLPAIAFASANGLRDRMFHDLDIGCYLVWEGYPRWRVFEDARLPAYPDDFHRTMDRTPLDPAAFDALLRRWDVDSALLARPDINMRAGSFDPATWALVYRTDEAMVLARRGSRHAATIARFEIPLRAFFAFQGGTRFEPLASPPAGSPVAPCEWDRRLGDALDSIADPERAQAARERALEAGCLPRSDEPHVRFLRGARLHRAGQPAAARAEYDRVLALSPDHASALANRGYLRLPTEPAAGRADLTRALALDPARADIRKTLAMPPR